MDRTNSMTEGNSMKQIVLFFFPIVVGNLFQQIYNLVDSMIVGKGIGDKALAAVGATGTLHFLVFGFVIGLTRGYGILFSQSFGKKDTDQLNRYITAAKKLSVIFSFLFTFICVISLRKVLTLMNTPADIINDSFSYFVIIAAGIIVTVFSNLEIVILQSLGNSRTPLLAMILSAVSNIILDLIFVMICKMGVSGAAIATVIAQLLSFIFCFHQRKSIDFLNTGAMLHPGEEKRIYWDLLRMGLPVAFMNSITALGAMALQFFVNLMGSAYVAAYAACMKYAALFEQFGVSAGLTMLTFVGQNKGAGQYERISKGVQQGLLLSVLINIPIAFVQIVFPGALAKIMLNDPVIIEYCESFLPILGICIFPLGWLFIYRFSVQGLGNTIVPMISGFLEVAMRLIFGSWLGRRSFQGIAVSEVSAWIGAWLMIMTTYYIMMHRHKDDNRK